MSKTLLVFSPHPDDEVISGGGTVIKLIQEGWSAHVVFLTFSDQAFYGEETKVMRQVRSVSEAKLATSDMGIHESNLRFEGLKDMYLTPGGELIRILIKHIRRVKPRVVFTTWDGDFHVDHRMCGIAIREAAYQSRQDVCGDLGEKLDAEPIVLLGEVDLENRTNLSKPNFWFDITDTVDTKVKALLRYDSLVDEHQLFGHEYLKEWCYSHARYRGHMVGVKYAEVFKYGNLSPPNLRVILT